MKKIPITHYKENSISRVYTFLNQYLYPKSEELINNFAINFGDINDYSLISPIGCGKYSLVFVGKCKNRLCAIKVLKKVSDYKIRRELYFMQKLSGIENVVKFYDIVRDDLTDTISVISEFVNFDSHEKLYPTLKIEDIKYYIYLLLRTIDTCHSRGIMHRDIKPGNVLINHRKQTLTIIDWGLAEMYFPYKQYTVRVSTMRYKAPELLLGYHFYDYGIDIWGVGCILSEMLFGLNFITGTSYQTVLQSISNIFGKDKLLQYIDKFGIEVEQETQKALDELSSSSEYSFENQISKMREDLRDSDAIDLLLKLLTIDHTERIVAREAMKHPFFSSIFA